MDIKDIPPGWQSGVITVDGSQRPALVRYTGGGLRVESEGPLTIGQTFRAYEHEWVIGEVELRENNVVYATCAVRPPGAVKPPFTPDYPKGATP